MNKLIAKLSRTARGIDPSAVVSTGATQIRTKFKAEEVPQIVAAYMSGIKTTMAIAIGGTGLALLVSIFGKWKRIHTKAFNDGDEGV